MFLFHFTNVYPSEHKRRNGTETTEVTGKQFGGRQETSRKKKWQRILRSSIVCVDRHALEPVKKNPTQRPLANVRSFLKNFFFWFFAIRRIFSFGWSKCSLCALVGPSKFGTMDISICRPLGITTNRAV